MATPPHNHPLAERLRADHRHFRFDIWQLAEAESFAQFPLNQTILASIKPREQQGILAQQQEFPM